MKKILFALLTLFSLIACQKDKHEQAIHLYKQGLTLEKQNYPDSAVQNYRKAIELLKGSEQHELISQIYNQYGDLLLENGVYEKASNAHRTALKYDNLLKDKSQVSRAYRGIGKNHYLQKNARKALFYFQKALDLNLQIKDQEEKSSLYNNLSNVYYILKDYDKALEYSRKAIQFTHDSLKIYRNYSVKGRIFTLLHQYDSAYYYLLIASQSQNIRTQASCFFKLSEMPTESGITDSMKYKYLNKAQLLQDSIEYVDNTVKISEAEYQHQLNLLKDEDNNKLIFIVLVTSLFALSLFVYIYFRYKRRIRKYQKRINRLYHEFGQKKDQVSENNDREKQLIQIISHTGNICCSRFTSSVYFKSLKSKLIQHNYALTYTELDELQKIILREFDVYIQQIAGIINLSTNDSVLCCLSLLKFTTKECAICRGVSSETIRSQKTRIKKKIPKTFFNNGLFNVIFGEE